METPKVRSAARRKDSVLVTPYEKFVLFDSLVKKRPLNGANYATNKTKMVAWFVSNCGASNGRLEYAHELQKYVQVDIYGDCGTLKCERHESENCLRMLDRDYRFYLAFENANCKDYITEKLYNALRHYVVPIVMGASSDEYYNAAPANSYIHVDDFASPRDLAWYLRRLSTNDTLYNQYFAWKGTGEFINTYFWCRLCALLHAPPAGAPPPYEDIGQWWKGKGVCAKEPQWPRKLANSRSRHHKGVSAWRRWSTHEFVMLASRVARLLAWCGQGPASKEDLLCASDAKTCRFFITSLCVDEWRRCGQCVYY
ncbi:fucosyltransferase, putative [Ixodes scapularis]|uniref:Fucosyltransferase n=1 Tax=Ixodes scapularis TaxID=6945 RepID=B7PE32_IXOSC|nr:fucosyltransferase, putative [Ixodes scapularis]|eukprot:XP_002399899.1 fucosyltransferase, putative [Ixodes scapularis]